jgi:phosphoribosylanthranilate isomerase
MYNAPDIKICGINNEYSITVAAQSGAHYLGFVFYPPSKRYISIEDAKKLQNAIPDHMESVGVFVDPSDEDLDKTLSEVPIDLIQLHGYETPERVIEIEEKFATPIIKAIHIKNRSDVSRVMDYDEICDFLLFDTKTDNEYGGSGKQFDWSLLEGLELGSPWILSGGLNENNITQALDYLTPSVVDISSGVETTPGQKSTEKIQSFISKVLNYSGET